MQPYKESCIKAASSLRQAKKMAETIQSCRLVAWIQEAMKNFGPFDRRYFALSSLSAEVISLADCTLEDLHFAINALKVDPKAHPPKVLGELESDVVFIAISSATLFDSRHETSTAEFGLPDQLQRAIGPRPQTPGNPAFNLHMNPRSTCAGATCVHGQTVFAGRPSKIQDTGRPVVRSPSSFDQSLEYLAAGALATVGLLVARKASSNSEDGGWLRQLVSPGTVCIMILVCQKCSTDALTWWTKARCDMSYSGANVTLISEVLKFPLLLTAIGVIKTPREVWPTIKTALKRRPFAMWWVGLLYAAQNLLYFVCLQYCSAATYQVLSQSKLIFTAGFMSQMLNKTFSSTQIVALGLLLLGTLLTQLAEVSGPAVLSGSAPWLGAGLTVLSALLSALPNVFYERLLKEDEDEWVTNLQLTTWICLWVMIIKAGGMIFLGTGPGIPSLAEATAGFNGFVWVIVALKVLNCIIIPSCLKYADNILYGYAKPISIVLTCAATSVAIGPWELGLFMAVMTRVMVWSGTKPEVSGSPIKDSDYLRRKPAEGSQYEQWKEMEDLVFNCFNREGSQVKGFVVAGGVLYGEGENIFVEMFKDAWRGVQSHVVVTPGINKVPTVHVRDMARVVRQVITNAEGINPLEATPYFLAVDQPPAAKEGQPSMPAAQSEIVQAIVDEMGEHYDVPRVPKASIDQGAITDLQDLQADPIGQDFCASLDPPGWVCKNGLLANLRTIADEFCAGKKLRSMRILIAGPPTSGKTNLAQAVADHFKVPHLSLPEEVSSADLDKTITQISSSVCHFRGYVLDAGSIGFAQAEKLFRYDIEVPKTEEEQEVEPEGGEPAPPKIERRLNEETCPAMVIITQAPAAICKARWQSSGASLETFEKSMQAYINNNLTQDVHSLQDFFQDVANKGVLNLPIAGKDEEDLFESARIYIERSGRPFNYLTPEEEVGFWRSKGFNDYPS
ncbi:AK7 [Symbiodinium natans]|uniref:AK7 protein n=1 Tax=Symbiodinium natans TaxID=878477 RepID=A0A812L8P5_9DINO|nr:AK7 [Symbiodinium natans]